MQLTTLSNSFQAPIQEIHYHVGKKLNISSRVVKAISRETLRIFWN